MIRRYIHECILLQRAISSLFLFYHKDPGMLRNIIPNILFRCKIRAPFFPFLTSLLLLSLAGVAPDTELAGYPANFLPDIRYPAGYSAE